MKKKDERLNFTSEVLSNIRTIKFYSWIEYFEEGILSRREAELKEMKKAFYRGSAPMRASYNFFPSILSSVVLATYIGTGHEIDLATTFTILVLLELIK